MTTMSPAISPQPVAVESRPRAVTGMSFGSTRSRRSSSSATKPDLTETAKDKKRLNTKADPSRALNEATPAEQAQEHATVEDIRAIMHKDTDGNVITDPDRSNPTRNRLERPLDTIRAFNAAAEGTSYRRSSQSTRSQSQAGWNNDSRRASYYSNHGYSPHRQQRPGGYYRNSSYGFGPQSSVEEEPGSAQMYSRNVRQNSAPYHGQGGHHQYNSGYSNGHPNGHQPYSNYDSPVSAHSYQHSYETMTSGSDDYGKSTNPSSQNSSNDQLPHLRKPDDPAFHPPYSNDIRFDQQPSPEQFQLRSPAQNPYGADAVQPPGAPINQYQPPPANNPRVPIKLNSIAPTDGSGAAVAAAAPPPSPPPKKQGWIKRTFSKRAS